jgi:hypothetical protein
MMTTPRSNPFGVRFSRMCGLLTERSAEHMKRPDDFWQPSEYVVNQQFARERIDAGSSPHSIDELYDEWREAHDSLEDSLAVAASLRDMEAGDTGRDFESFFASDISERSSTGTQRWWTAFHEAACRVASAPHAYPVAAEQLISSFELRTGPRCFSQIPLLISEGPPHHRPSSSLEWGRSVSSCSRPVR